MKNTNNMSIRDIIQQLIKKNGSTEHDGHTYALTQPAYIDGAHEVPYYRAMAIRTDCTPDQDECVPSYGITWTVTDPDILAGTGDDESNACDWEHPASVVERGEYYIFRGYHV